MAIVCASARTCRSDPTLFARAVTALERCSAAIGVAGGVAPEHHVRVARCGRAACDEPAARRVFCYGVTRVRTFRFAVKECGPMSANH